jgi:hypothetical protein
VIGFIGVSGMVGVTKAQMARRKWLPGPRFDRYRCSSSLAAIRRRLKWLTALTCSAQATIRPRFLVGHHRQPGMSAGIEHAQRRFQRIGGLERRRGPFGIKIFRFGIVGRQGHEIHHPDIAQHGPVRPVLDEQPAHFQLPLEVGMPVQRQGAPCAIATVSSSAIDSA